MNHNDNPIKVIKTDASGTKQTIGELFPNQLPYQTITIDVKTLCVAFAEWVENLEHGIYLKYNFEELFDIFIKEYKP